MVPIALTAGGDDEEDAFVSLRGFSTICFWADDVATAVERLLSMGAREYQPITPRGEAGFVTAAVVDPFGNVLGLMYNPHDLEVLASTKPA